MRFMMSPDNKELLNPLPRWGDKASMQYTPKMQRMPLRRKKRKAK